MRPRRRGGDAPRGAHASASHTGRDLGAGASGLAWTINAYLLPLGALILIGGGVGDHFGRRRLFMIGLATFSVASIACALAPDLAWLLGGRSLQGVGAALLMPNSLAIRGWGPRSQSVAVKGSVGIFIGASLGFVQSDRTGPVGSGRLRLSWWSSVSRPSFAEADQVYRRGRGHQAIGAANLSSASADNTQRCHSGSSVAPRRL